VGFELRPNFQARDFLTALLASIFASGTTSKDFDVATRKFDLAMREVTRLLKLKSELRERVKLSRATVERASGVATQARADRRIFEEKYRRPAAGRVLFVLPVTSEAQKRHDSQLAQMKQVEGAAFAKLREEQAAAKKLAKELAEVSAAYTRAEEQRLALGELVTGTAVQRMLGALATEDIDSLSKTFNSARERTRGDRRLLIVRIFAEAVLANPHQAFGLLHECRQSIGPETGAPYRLLRSLLDFLNGSDLSPTELGAFTEGNFTYPEEYAIYRFLQVANGMVPEGLGETPEEGGLDALLAFMLAWRSGEPGAVTLKVKDWTREPLRTEFSLVAYVAREEYANAVGVFGVDLPELEADLVSRRHDLTAVQTFFMRLAEQRALVDPIFKPGLERVFCLFLAALKELALPETSQVAREILRPENCGNIHDWYRWRAADEKLALGFQRDPADLYWPPEKSSKKEE